MISYMTHFLFFWEKTLSLHDVLYDTFPFSFGKDSLLHDVLRDTFPFPLGKDSPLHDVLHDTFPFPLGHWEKTNHCIPFSFGKSLITAWCLTWHIFFSFSFGPLGKDSSLHSLFRWEKTHHCMMSYMTHFLFLWVIGKRLITTFPFPFPLGKDPSLQYVLHDTESSLHVATISSLIENIGLRPNGKMLYRLDILATLQYAVHDTLFFSLLREKYSFVYRPNRCSMSSEGGSLKIYFCGSICGGRQDQVFYEKIINHLKTYGKVLTEAIGNPKLTEQGTVFILFSIHKIFRLFFFSFCKMPQPTKVHSWPRVVLYIFFFFFWHCMKMKLLILEHTIALSDNAADNEIRVIFHEKNIFISVFICLLLLKSKHG